MVALKNENNAIIPCGHLKKSFLLVGTLSKKMKVVDDIFSWDNRKTDLIALL